VNRVLHSTPPPSANVFDHVVQLTLDIIGLSAFGFEFQAVQSDDNRIYNAYNAVHLEHQCCTDPHSLTWPKRIDV
jgi:hypothetical protein